MGFGDELIGSGIAKRVRGQGKRVAFGDGRKIIWSKEAHEIYRGNSSVARPGEEKASDLVWVKHYSGCRLYARAVNGHWVFNDYKCIPGEIVFTQEELEFAYNRGQRDFVVIEPYVKRVAPNKQWPVARYQAVADALTNYGVKCVQFVPPNVRPLLNSNVGTVVTPSFRHAVAMLAYAKCYIGPEGGLHHASAAVGIDAVVLFGGFNTPKSTGYDYHVNITVGEPCGTIAKCEHCTAAMQSITVERVLHAALHGPSTSENEYDPVRQFVLP